MTELTCIVCPRGCRLLVDEKHNFSVRGNGCPRGAEYGRRELTAPTRRLTSTVKVRGGEPRRCPVKTSAELPREFIVQAMALLDGLEIAPPLAAGSTVARDIAGTGIDWITTKKI